MTGLDLESFLLLLRADLSAWLVMGLASIGLALLVWLCWGTRRALRKCLVLSLAAHLGLVLYGSTVPAVQFALRGVTSDSAERSHIRRIQIAPLVESANPPGAGTSTVREGDTAADGGSGDPRLGWSWRHRRSGWPMSCCTPLGRLSRIKRSPSQGRTLRHRSHWGPRCLGRRARCQSRPRPVRLARRPCRPRATNRCLHPRCPRTWPKSSGNRPPRRPRRARRVATVLDWSRRPWGPGT